MSTAADRGSVPTELCHSAGHSSSRRCQWTCKEGLGGRKCSIRRTAGHVSFPIFHPTAETLLASSAAPAPSSHSLCLSAHSPVLTHVSVLCGYNPSLRGAGGRYGPHLLSSLVNSPTPRLTKLTSLPHRSLGAAAISFSTGSPGASTNEQSPNRIRVSDSASPPPPQPQPSEHAACAWPSHLEGLTPCDQRWGRSFPGVPYPHSCLLQPPCPAASLACGFCFSAFLAGSFPQSHSWLDARRFLLELRAGR